MNFKFIPQRDQMDCGPSCIAMIARYYGKNYSLNYLRDNAHISRAGISISGIKIACKKIGLDTISVQLTLNDLIERQEYFPCILYWNQSHFVVLRKIEKSRFSDKLLFHIADPEYGLIRTSEDDFNKSWLNGSEDGIAIFLTTGNEFYELSPPEEEKINVKFLFKKLLPFKKEVISTFLLLLLGSLMTLVFPFLTEALIDKGVNTKDVNFIFIILLAQLGVFTGSILINIFRNWIMLYMGANLSINIISDFLKKLLQLPLSFFETRMLGDFNQRIQDNDRIEEFLTSQGIITFFSIITFSVFFGVLGYYDYKILLIYFILTFLSVTWSFYWLRKRKILDFHKFQLRGQAQESIFEILKGVHDLKLNQFEYFKRDQWKKIETKLFKLNTRILKVDQIQHSGFEFINQTKNIIVTFLAATYVVQDEMTLGALLSISYIIGQMNSPINQLTEFLKSFQDAKLSLVRLNEVENHEQEELDGLKKLEDIKPDQNNSASITFENVSFQYEGPNSPFVLKDINIEIPEGKVTAIVGASGSGKTTLLKLLLRYYPLTNGEVYFGSEEISNISPLSIRKSSGVVMQNGYLFTDTIERNIATSDIEIDPIRLNNAVTIANCKDFVESLPLQYKTKIGDSGMGLSGGQQQRILIARAIYKNPHYIFLDEATSALDAENENIIHHNLQQFFRGKTVIIIAHRLSTVKHADQIIMLKNGKVAEIGNHNQLVENKSDYYTLVKNQLELGN